MKSKRVYTEIGSDPKYCLIRVMVRVGVMTMMRVISEYDIRGGSDVKGEVVAVRGLDHLNTYLDYVLED